MAGSAAGVKIMLVDDEEEFVHALAERLETRGLKPSVAYDGEQALAMVEQQEPEIMVLDLRMPGLHGLEVLRRLKQTHPQVQVIILTGHGSDADEDLAGELGAAAYMQKPVDLHALIDAMKAAYLKSKGRPWPGEGG